MSGGGAPKPPDPIETAAAQSKVNKETIFENAKVNQIAQTTPFGSTRWEGDIGEQNRHQITELNPQLQNLFFGGGGLLGQIGDTVGQPLDFSSAPSLNQGGPSTASFNDGRFSGFGSSNNIAGRQFSSNDNYDSSRFGSAHTGAERFSTDDNPGAEASSAARHGWGAPRQGGGAMARQGGYDNAGRGTILDANEGFQGRQMLSGGQGGEAQTNLEAIQGRQGPGGMFSTAGRSNADGSFTSGRFQSGAEGLGSGEYRNHALTRPGDFGDERASYEKAMFDRGMHLLRPEFDKQQSNLDRRLYQRGIAEGSQASNDQRQSFGDRRARAYGDLAMSSVAAGATEQSRLADMASRNRDQLFNEDRTLVNDRFGRDLASSGENRAIIGEQFGRDQTAINNAFGRDLALYSANQAERQNAFGRDATTFGLNEQSIQNAFGRDLSSFGATEGSFQNAFGRDLASSAENRAGVNEQFGRDLSSRQQAIAEQMAQRNQPISDLTSLLSGVAPGGVPGMPQFTQFASSAPDIMGMTGSNYASQANMYGARMGAMGSIAGGLLGMFSDRRLKEDIRPVGKLANGLTVYTFKYRHTGGPMQLGLMSDEVREIRPEAVSVDSSGYDVVDYEKAVR